MLFPLPLNYGNLLVRSLSMTNLPILTLGAATRDVFLASEAFTVVRSPQFSSGFGECVNLGAKIDIDDCIFTTGGGASNAAVTFTRLGFPTSIVANVGNDEIGNAVLYDLEHYGVDTSYIKRHRIGKTGYSTLLTTSSGERTVLVFRGVSSTWQKKDLPPLREKIRALYVTSLGGDLNMLEHVLLQAKKAHIPVACNPGNGELRQGAKLLKILPLVHTLFLNKEEAEQLIAQKSNDIPLILKKLHQYVPNVVLTNGSQGSYAHTNEGAWFARPSSHVPVVSRTGAGDAFGSGFFAARIAQKEVSEALQIGTLNAESVIQRVGAKTGILQAWPTGKRCATIRVTQLSQT